MVLVKRILLFVSAVVSLVSYGESISGIDRGNGTDYVRFEDQGAWFTGQTNVVKYCVEYDPNFGVTEVFARQQIRLALKAWKDYAQTHGNPGITFETKELAKCGNQDLRFVLGYENNVPNTTNSTQDFTQHLGEAVRISYDLKTGWGNGYIWIARLGSRTYSESDAWKNVDPVFPNWSAPNTLKAILMHELGHTYGAEHIDETIMDADLAKTILNYHELGHKLQNIDGYRQFIRGRDAVPGILGLPFEPADGPFHACIDETAQRFEMLTGRKPNGPVKADFLIKPMPNNMNAVLTVSDNSGSYSLPIKMTLWGSDRASAKVKIAFKTIKYNGNGWPPSSAGIGHGSDVSYGTLTTLTGKMLNVVWENNMRASIQRAGTFYALTGDVLKYFTPKGMSLLFTSSYEASGWTGAIQAGDENHLTCQTP